MLPLPKHLSQAIEDKMAELACGDDPSSLCQRLRELVAGQWSPKIQDIRCLKTGNLLYKEVLYAPRQGAGAFFDALEAAGDDVLFNACSHAINLHIMDYLPTQNVTGPFGFNVEGTELLDASLIQQKKAEMLRLYPLGGLVIELTERDRIAEHRDDVLQFIHWAHERGFKVALDDFGAGAHCLEDVYSLPIDYLKVDGSVVPRILDQKDCDCCQSVREAMRYCTEHNIPVIAEHAPDGSRALLDAGFTHVQSYAVAEPVNLRVRS